MVIMAIILDTLNYVLFAVGAFLCIRAFARYRNKGYLLVTLYFVLSFVFMASKQILYTRDDAERIRQAQSQVAQTQGIPVPIRHTTLPILPLVLVAGIWLITKDREGTSET